MITHSIEINCRPEDAFAYLEQLERHCGWQREIVSTSADTPGPVRVSTHVREMRRIGGLQRNSSYEVTEHDPPRQHSFRGVGGAVRPVGTVTIEPIGDVAATRVSIEFNLLGRGFGKVIAPLARKAARKSIVDSQQQLKARLETTHAA